MLRYEWRSDKRRMQDLDVLRAAHRQETEDRLRESERREREIEKLLNAQKLNFNNTVAKLRASRSKVREEQRVAMQQKIDEFQKKDSKGRAPWN